MGQQTVSSQLLSTSSTDSFLRGTIGYVAHSVTRRIKKNMKRNILFILSFTLMLIVCSLTGFAQVVKTVTQADRFAGGGGNWIHVTGTGFDATTSLQFNGIDVTPTNIVIRYSGADGSTSVLFPISGVEFAGLATLAVRVKNNVGGNFTYSNIVTLTVSHQTGDVGSILIFPYYSFSGAPGTTGSTSTRLTIRNNGDADFDPYLQSIFAKVLFIGAGSSITQFYVSFGNSGSRTVELADLPNMADTSGVIVVIAVTSGGAPLRANVLSGNTVIRRLSSNTAGYIDSVIEPYCIKKLNEQGQNPVNGKYSINFDGVDYERLPGSVVSHNQQNTQYRISTFKDFSMPTDVSGAFATLP